MAAHSSTSKPQSAMAQLLASHKNKFVTLKKGESVKAKITKLTSGEILVDTGAKTEALVLEKDKRILNTILSMFKVGDTVDVNVLNPESDSGQPVVSLRRYLGNMAWVKLEELQKSKEGIEVVVSELTKAGFLVNTDFGVAGFLPQSHTSVGDIAAGQKLTVTVLELNRKDNKIIFSQKAAMSEEDFNEAAKQFKTGAKVKGTISNVTPFGVFMTLTLKGGKTVEGFVHISEVSWDKVADLSALYKSGDAIEAVLTRFDDEAKRINLSVKRLTQDPFEEVVAKFPVDAKVTGEVTKVDDSGVTLLLEDEVEGVIKKDKIPPTVTYTVGQKVNATVSEHDKKRHKVILTPVLLEKPLMYR